MLTAVRPLLDGPSPDAVHEVGEVSYHAITGDASVLGDVGPASSLAEQRTSPWPRPMRARVSARGRDDADETYEIAVWSAPAAPEEVLKAFARGGQVLDSYEPLYPYEPTDPEVAAAPAGIDWADYIGVCEKGLAAVERFTGHGIRPEHVDQLADAYLVADEP